MPIVDRPLGKLVSEVKIRPECDRPSRAQRRMIDTKSATLLVSRARCSLWHRINSDSSLSVSHPISMAATTS